MDTVKFIRIRQLSFSFHLMKRVIVHIIETKILGKYPSIGVFEMTNELIKKNNKLQTIDFVSFVSI